MISDKLPRNLSYSLLLAIFAAAVMLSMFYGQYRWLANEILDSSSEQHELALRNSFVRRMHDQLEPLTEQLSSAVSAGDRDGVTQALKRFADASLHAQGLRYTDAAGQSFVSGTLPDVENVADTAWLQNNLIISIPIRADTGEAGDLTVAFSLDELKADVAAFGEQLTTMAPERRRLNYVWSIVGAVVTLLVLGLVAYLIARDRAKRIREMKHQAEKLRDSDFGQRLPENRDDDLGDLAAVFNEMRDRLRTTTISRDYVDSILSSMNDAIIVTTRDGEIKRINEATSNLIGHSSEELIGTSIDKIVDTRKSGSLVQDTPSGFPRDAFFTNKSGESIPVSYTCSILEGKEAESGDRIYAAQNITERRRAEQRIRYLARIDALTKIPNRMQFQHLLQRAIARARRNRRSLCMFYVDIDCFKDINDTFGHLAGDTTLETVAERLAESLPDNSVIGRLAGDEFAVIVDRAHVDSEGTEKIDAVAKKVLAKLAEPFFVQGHEVFMTASMGIALYPQHASNVIDLIRNADAALYHSKKSGGNTHSYYRPQMNEAAVERLMTKSKLKRAFERNELLVHYQPKYNLETGEVFGAEALVRWELPERGMILPADFIPIAEETNLIIEIGEWVLDKVCEDFRFWQRSVSSPGRVSVNLSLKQLRQRNFSKRIGALLRSYEVSPTSLELEITETTLMENPERTIKLLNELYALGLHLAIDDFGTGYSSLSALQQFPISTLKVDKSFVDDVATDPDDAILVGTIVQMGKNMNMDVVAEGVESEEQLAFLQSIGCTYAQGLLFGDPMSSDSYLELLLAQMDGTDAHKALFA